MVKHGIDVSKFQGLIDWQEVKKHIDFAIIRCGYGSNLESQDDPYFKRNADECTRLKIPFGVYLYSYATNEREALSEAEHVLRLVKDYQMAYPVYYDLEDNNTTPNFNEYTKWIARYNDELNYDGEYGMWQYSATGNVLGIDTMVDLNYAYKDFPQIIEEGGYNNFSNKNLTRYKIGDEVEFHHVFLTSESTQPLMPYRHFGIITRIVQGARNPYLIGQDAGWVNDQVIERKIRYLSAPDYTGNSFTDALRSIQEDASFANRTKLAKLNGIDNYTGSQRQNDELLRLLKEGKLRI